MALGVNNITVVGNLTRDPELRFTPNGTPVASFSVAVNRNYKDKESGEWVNSADFFNIVAWFKLAENCAESLSKGDRVLIAGKLSQDTWENKDGQKRSTYRIVANTVAPSLEFATCRIDKNERADTVDAAPKKEDPDEDLDFSDDDIPF